MLFRSFPSARKPQIVRRVYVTDGSAAHDSISVLTPVGAEHGSGRTGASEASGEVGIIIEAQRKNVAEKAKNPAFREAVAKREKAKTKQGLGDDRAPERQDAAKGERIERNTQEGEVEAVMHKTAPSMNKIMEVPAVPAPSPDMTVGDEPSPPPQIVKADEPPIVIPQDTSGGSRLMVAAVLTVCVIVLGIALLIYVQNMKVPPPQTAAGEIGRAHV